MRLIIVGCGRMGGGLARRLVETGHEVTVVDKDPDAFSRLGSAFKGRTVVGIGFDGEALEAAGVRRADGLAAVTASDDVNVVTARVARQIFHVPRVVARVYDPHKADIYRRLGLPTVSTTVWGIQRMAELLCFSHLDAVASLGSGEVDLVETETPPTLVGRTVADLTLPGEVHVVAITRRGHTFLPSLGAVFEADDLIHLAVTNTASNRLVKLLG
ncbi:MAG: NAD-binding protein [Anaerolineae bacterium]|nr:NAD-binding protein [Anaerolineae bacterium]